MAPVCQQTSRSPPEISSAPNAHVDQFIHEFDTFLEVARGLTHGTRRKYCRFVRSFLSEWTGSGCALDWPHLLSVDVLRAHVRRELSSKKRRPSNAPFVALRSMLCFLSVKGVETHGLEEALPRIRRWRHAALPVNLSRDEVDRVISFSTDREAPHSLRNRAIVLLLARTGMRAAEVVKLTLDDIDWSNGTIYVRDAKSRSDRALPLSREVGRALLAYVKRERPSSEYRTIFLQAAPPWRTFSDSSAISKIVRCALTRANIRSSRGAAHLLRHSAATNMLSQGVSFKNIADVLGHRSLESTAIYAKLDLPALSRIAMPWPGDIA